MKRERRAEYSQSFVQVEEATKPGLHYCTTLTVGTMYWNPFQIKLPDGKSIGLLPDILNGLADMSNFTINWQVPDNKKYEKPLETGHGMV